jgi:cell wall-associated NlpC family hydrolase
MDPGNLVPSRHQTPGIDCSDFTAWVYNYALGIKMTSGIVEQAALTSVTNASGATITIQKIQPTSNFNSLVAQFQPGDLLYSAWPIFRIYLTINNKQILNKTKNLQFPYCKAACVLL